MADTKPKYTTAEEYEFFQSVIRGWAGKTIYLKGTKEKKDDKENTKK